MCNDAWRLFKGNQWKEEINVSAFIEDNYTEYLGDDGFLASTSDKTKKVWDECIALFAEENKNGVLDIEMDTISGINNFKPGYINKEDNV